ncbi:hypothetical protein [Kitasatospora sp. SolWspMP-SS2h]|uniref:hypothetical protein n=1 Tax=Kitasatospora sp. SolWspMP-SS2h TaxID=1305729 RepID=UPI000DB9EFE7|nr:hypothetical protein [Kitasatospora sp. SolWspMP-SS2h]
MVGTVLIVVLLLVLGGCACVVWAARGGPGWVRAVSRVTLGVGEVVRRAERDRQRRGFTSGKSGTSNGD